MSEVHCPECDNSDLYKKGFRNGKQRYQCKKCGRYFVEGTRFVGRAVKLPTVNSTCPYCGGTHILRDGRLEDGTARFKCADCQRRYSNKTVVLAPVEYPCPYCGGKLKRAGHGKLGQVKYLCTECGKNCSGDPPKKLIKFKDINTNISCPYCNSMNIKLGGTATRKTLTRYLCNDCGRAFTEETKGRLEKIKQETRYTEICPRCGGHRIISAGIGRTGKERFRCRDCKRTYTKGSKLIAKDMHRKPPISNQDKKTILMYRLNLGISIAEIAKHFNCSEYAVKQLEKEYRNKVGI